MKRRFLSLVLACALVLGLLPPMQLAWNAAAADTVSVSTIPIYNDQVFAQIRDDYIYNTDSTAKTTVYASAAVLYKPGDHDAHITWGADYHPGDTNNLRPSVEVRSYKSKSWYAEFEMFDYRTYRYFIKNPDVQMRFGAKFTTTKKSKPTMTVSGVTIGSDAGSNATTRLDGTATPSETIRFEGGPDTGISGAWAALIDNATAVPETGGITAALSGNWLSLDIPMDEALRWANPDAYSYADQIYITVRLTDMTTGIQDTQEIKLTFDSLQGPEAGINATYFDTIRFTGKIDDKWANGHFSVSMITAGKIPTVTDLSFEVYGMLGIKEHSHGSFSDYYDNAAKKIMDVNLDTTPLTDIAGNKVDLSSLTNLKLSGSDIEFDNLNPDVVKVYVTQADGIGNLEVSRNAGNANQWPEEIDRSQLFLGNGKSMTFAVDISEAVLNGVTPASSDVTALLNVLDENGQQVAVKLASVQYLSPANQEKFGRTKLVFEPFTAATGMTMMEGENAEAVPIKIVELRGTIKDGSGNKLTGSIPAPDEQLYLDAQAPLVKVERLASSDPNLIELLLTVSDKDANGGKNAGLLEQHNNDDDQNLALWLTGASGPDEMHFTYTLDTYPTTTAEASGSLTLGSQKSGDGIRYAMRALDETTMKLTVYFEPADVSSVDGLELHIQVNDVVDNVTGTTHSLDYKLDQVPPELTLGAVQYELGVSSAKVTIPVTVTDLHNQVVKLEYAWSDGYQTEIANITPGETVNYNIVKTYNDNDTHSETLSVWATDSFGRVSVVKYANVFVDLQTPATAYSYQTPKVDPQASPVLDVYGPGARISDGAAAYTRVNVTMGDDTFVRLVKTGESTQIFDFDGTWYRVSHNGTHYESVEQVSDLNALRSFYGPVTVTFESAFTNLTPVKGASLVPTGAGYYADPALISILYAPDQTEAVHGISWDCYADADGSAIEGEGTILCLHTMTNTRIDFTLVNLLQKDWGLSDIDFDASYLEFYTINNDAVMILRGLEPVNSQSFFVPSRTEDGRELPTGAYRLTVHIVKKDGRTDTYSADRDLLLDAETVRNEGIWKYELRDGARSVDSVVHVAQDEPFENIGMVMSVRQETYRDDFIACYTNGITQTTLTLSADEYTITHGGITAGKVEGFRLWPMAANLTEAELENLAYLAPNYREDGTASYLATFGTALVTAAEYPQGTAGVPEAGQDLYLIKGANVFCYQVKMENGKVSPVRQFTIFVTEELPVLEMSLDSITPSIIRSEIDGMTNVQDLTMKLDSAFSLNGSGKVTVTMYTHNAQVNGEYRGDTVVLSENDLITINEDSYTGKFTEELDDETTTLFIARDEYGGTMIIAPQIGSEYRLGSTDSIDVNYLEYPINYWTEVMYGIEYNAPQYDDEGNITGYRSHDVNSEKLGIDRTTAATLDYNRYAINTEVPRLYGAGFRHIGPYIIHTHDVDHGEYIDWSTVTLTLPTLDGGTVTLPMDYSGPNDAGFIRAEYDGYGEFAVYIANPASSTLGGQDAFSYTPFQINGLDIGGNPLGYDPENGDTTPGFAGGYRLTYQSSQPTGSVYGDGGNTLRMPVATWSATPTDVDCIYNNYAGNYYWQIATGIYNAGTYSGTYTDYFGSTHAFDYQTEAYQPGLDITVTPATPTTGPVTVILKNPAGESITVADDQEGQTVTGNGTQEVTVVLTMNGYVTYRTASIEENSFPVSNIVDPSLQIRWSYDPYAVSVDENGTPYHYGPVTAWLVSGEDAVDVMDNYTGELPSYTFYPGEPTSYTFPAGDFSVLVGGEAQEHGDYTVTLELELRSFENPPAEDAPADADAPAVQLRAYAQRNGLFGDDQQLLQVGPAHLMEGMTHYDGDTVHAADGEYADTTGFVTALGWASAFRFQVELMDESKVKLFVKHSLFASAPDYNTGVSDTVPGVALNGRILEVSAPADFALFAVDELGNTAIIPLTFSNVGPAPVPQVVKIPGSRVIYAYLLPPNGSTDEITDLKLTYPANAAQATEGDFAGYWYAPLETNGLHTLNYSFTYRGELIEGKLEVKVNELNTTPIELEPDGIVWCANKQQPRTRYDVTAVLWFTQNVDLVQVPAEFVDRLSVLIVDNRVTVRYTENVEQVTLTVVATNGTGIHVPLDAVTNIDKDAPQILDSRFTLSDDGRSVTAYFLLSEQTVCAETSALGTDNGDGTYTHTWQIHSNGYYEISFTDLAGNHDCNYYSYTVSNIVNTPLELLFSTDPDFLNGTFDPDNLELTVGDTVFVRANRDCTVTMNGEQPQNAQADIPVRFSITENDAGLWPIIHAVDAYGNTAAGQFGRVVLPDRTPPHLALNKTIVIVDTGLTRDDIYNLLIDNLVVSDADTEITVDVAFTDNLDAAGTSAVTYTATDSSGNRATITGWLRITEGGELTVTINEEHLERDSLYLTDPDSIRQMMVIDAHGQSFRVVWKKGVKSLGQMKTGTTELFQGRDETVFPLPEEWEPGYYTICIKVQNRDEFRILVYVND